MNLGNYKWGFAAALMVFGASQSAFSWGVDVNNRVNTVEANRDAYRNSGNRSNSDDNFIRGDNTVNTDNTRRTNSHDVGAHATQTVDSNNRFNADNISAGDGSTIVEGGIRIGNNFDQRSTNNVRLGSGNATSGNASAFGGRASIGNEARSSERGFGGVRASASGGRAMSGSAVGGYTSGTISGVSNAPTIHDASIDNTTLIFGGIHTNGATGK